MVGAIHNRVLHFHKARRLLLRRFGGGKRGVAGCDIKLGLALGSAPHRFRRNAVATGGWADAHNSFSLGPIDEFGKWNGSCIQSALDRAGTRVDANMESRATETAPSQAKLFAL